MESVRPGMGSKSILQYVHVGKESARDDLYYSMALVLAATLADQSYQGQNSQISAAKFKASLKTSATLFGSSKMLVFSISSMQFVHHDSVGSPLRRIGIYPLFTR